MKLLTLTGNCFKIAAMLPFLVILIGFLSRIVVHTPNFSPVYALALFSGIYLKGRQPLWVPVMLMVLSDVFLGFYPGMAFTWAGILMVSLIGLWLKDHKNWANVVSTSLLSSVVFFAISNFGSYLSLYPHTWAGLQQCYAAAVPFYRSALLSTLAYSVLLFSLWEYFFLPKANSMCLKESAV